MTTYAQHLEKMLQSEKIQPNTEKIKSSHKTYDERIKYPLLKKAGSTGAAGHVSDVYEWLAVPTKRQLPSKLLKCFHLNNC